MLAAVDPEATEQLSLEDLQDAWSLLVPEDRVESFRALNRPDAEDLFLFLSSHDQAELLFSIPANERRAWFRLLAPDDAADLIQEVDPEQREILLGLLDEQTRRDVVALLAYAEDDAGGLMNPRYARVRPDITIDEAITYLRRQAAERTESLPYAYVLDQDQKLRGVVSYRELFTARTGQRVAEVMATDVVSVPEAMDQEEVSQLFTTTRLLAIPVVDAQGRMKGIVTLDDVVDVVREEATEDIQKIGGTAVLEAPYLQVTPIEMIRKRGGWLAVLFVGETLTAAAMGYFQLEIAKAVALALFIPLVISSGGNSGGQATTLVIRAMALGEVRLRDWWRVVHREFFSGLGLGGILALLGFLQVVTMHRVSGAYGPHYLALGATLALSLVGVVLWGTMVGSMLPFLLRRMNFDPATASAPFVATLVDVTGLMIYFTAARLLLTGTLL